MKIVEACVADASGGAEIQSLDSISIVGISISTMLDDTNHFDGIQQTRKNSRILRNASSLHGQWYIPYPLI